MSTVHQFPVQRNQPPAAPEEVADALGVAIDAAVGADASFEAREAARIRTPTAPPRQPSCTALRPSVSHDVWRGGTGQVPRGGPAARGRARRRAGRYRREVSGMTALSRMTARLSALRAASGLGRRSMAASCA